MPFHIIRQDITKIETDAVVNPTDEKLSGAGGVDFAIHTAAGNELREECRALGGCKTGEAKATHGFNLPVKFVIHTVGPKYRGGKEGEAELLVSCCRNSLALAEKLGCKSIAFPLISAGTFGCPAELVLKTLTAQIRKFLRTKEMDVYLCVFGQYEFRLSGRLFGKIQQFIDDNYVAEHSTIQNIGQLARFSVNGQRQRLTREPENKPWLEALTEENEDEYEKGAGENTFGETVCASALGTVKFGHNFEEETLQLDESFMDCFNRLLKEKGMKPKECYTAANLDRKTFSKIKQSGHISKIGAVSLAVGLGLTLCETLELLKKAGYTLSNSLKFDVIIVYCLKKRIYDIDEINLVLFDNDQPLLGTKIR